MNRYWVASTDASFSSTNWSLTSGGSPGQNAPDSTNIVYFDLNGTGNCHVDVPANVYKLVVDSGYTGTIFQDSMITVGLGNADFSGGQFSGGSTPITINGDFNLVGTDFTSTSNILSVRQNLLCTAPQKFHPNDGTVFSYAEDKTFSPGGLFFHSLSFVKDSEVYDHQVIDSTCFVTRDLVLSGGFIRNEGDSTVYALGDVHCDAGFGQFTSEQDAVISMTGSSPQSLFSDGGVFPHLYIDKTTSNPVKVFGSYPLYINGDLIIFDGTFNTNRRDIIQGNLAGIVPIPPEPLIAGFTWVEERAPLFLTNFGSNAMYQSIDGPTWTKNLLYNTLGSWVVYCATSKSDGSFWVLGGRAVGSNIYLTSFAYSTDNVTFTFGNVEDTTPNQFMANCWDIKTNDTVWVAVGVYYNTIAYSLDGINWVGCGSTILTEGYKVAWNGSIWVAVGLGSTYVSAYSTDGINWYGGMLAADIPAGGLDSLDQIVWDGTKWLAYGGWGSGVEPLATSLDGISWTPQVIGTPSGGITGIVYNNSLFSAVGTFTNPIASYFAYSSDGVTWTAVTSVFDDGPTGIAEVNGIYVASGGSSSNNLAYSFDGINWTGADIPVAYTRYIAGGYSI